jgi:peptide-methionine (S)-S-oxide reductase
MKKLSLYMFALVGLLSCANAQSEDHSFAKFPALAKGERVATFAGGCFWALQEGMSELNGVSKVISGYAGGTVKNPTYEEVCTRTTGHAESVQVYYNPAVINYATLAEAFFYAHDPTTLNRQGPDVGTDYRSVAFYRSLEEKSELERVIKKVNASKHYPNKIVTEVVPFKIIYPAEKYHQGYYRQHPNQPYIRSVSMPKVMKLRKEMNDQLKPEFRTKPTKN